jgi:cell division topological specificity factor
MSLWKKILGRSSETASIAKERLQIIISHERSRREGPDYLPMLQKELVAVISKYVHINPRDVHVNLDRTGDFSILELNVTLPEAETAATS